MNEEILIPISLFAMIAAIVVVPRYYKRREREKLYETLRVAYEKGQAVDPALVEMLHRGEKGTVPAPVRDLRVGVILLMVALAIALFGWVTGEFVQDVGGSDVHDVVVAGPMLGIAAFPGFIGLAYIVFWLVGRGKRSGTKA